jgi:hypothetical protein
LWSKQPVKAAVAKYLPNNDSPGDMFLALKTTKDIFELQNETQMS